MGVWFSCLSHTSAPNAAATCGQTYCGVGGTSVARNCAADSMAARSGKAGGVAATTCIHGLNIRDAPSTVTVQLFDPNHPTGPLLYMALQTKQDHRLPAQLAARLAQRIENHALRPGTRLPSIRNCAEESRVSRSTVVEAYDQLIAAGLIESRRGSGFYVRLRNHKAAHRRAAAPAIARHRARRELAAARAAPPVARQRTARRGPAPRRLARSRNGRGRRARRGAQPRLVAAQVRRGRRLSTAARGAEHAARRRPASSSRPSRS